MSFILDALNKAQRDENVNKNTVPDLTVIHESPALSTDPSLFSVLRVKVSLLPKWMSVAILVLVLLLIGLLVARILENRKVTSELPVLDLSPKNIVASPESRAKETISTTSVSKTVIPEPVTPKISEPEMAQSMTEDSVTVKGSEIKPENSEIDRPDEVDIDPEIQALYEGGGEAVVIRPSKKVEPKPTPTSTKSTAKSVDAALAQELWDASALQKDTPLPQGVTGVDSEAELVTISPEPVTVSVDANPVQAPFEDTLAGHVSTPFLHDLSENVQTKIPTLMYSEHQYNNGYVVINRQTLQAGEQVASVTVKKILADGVILTFGERTFKLASLSSWVNY